MQTTMMLLSPPVRISIGEVFGANQFDGMPVIEIAWPASKEISEDGLWKVVIGIEAAKRLLEGLPIAISAIEKSQEIKDDEPDAPVRSDG